MSFASESQERKRRRSLWRWWREFRERRVEERAMRLLKSSIREAGSELSLEWVRSDPDLEELQDNAEWEELLRRSPKHERQRKQEQSTKLKPPPPTKPGPLPVPARPWGSPARRISRTVVVVSAATGVLLWATGGAPGGWLIAVGILAIALWRIVYLAWELHLDTSQDLLPRPPGGPRARPDRARRSRDGTHL